MAVACTAAMVAVGSVRAAEVRNLRVWAGPEYTRAVFDVSGPADYKLFELAKPDRIVLDIHASTLADSFGAPAAKGLLKGIRAGKQGKDDARIVFDWIRGRVSGLRDVTRAHEPKQRLEHGARDLRR